MNNNLLVKGIEVVGILFAAFGGFLAGVAPPEAADSRFAVGISSFLMLIMLLLISALTKKKYRTAWIVTAGVLFIVTVAAAYFYKTNLNALTFEYPPGNTKAEHIAGLELTPPAREYRDQHPGTSNSQLVAKYGGLQNKDKVWSAESVQSARTKLIAGYVVLVLAIAGAIFALTEGVLGSSQGVRKTSRRSGNKQGPVAAAGKSTNSEAGAG